MQSLHNQNILLISPEPWDHIHVSKHHYAIELARGGNKVFFLNPPTNGNETKESTHKNLIIVNYKGFVKGLSKFPKLIRKRITRQTFRQIESQCGQSFDIIWSFDNSVFYDLGALPQSVLKISHIVDLNMNFQFELAARGADICIGNTSTIVDKLLKINPNSHFINHGFAKSTAQEHIEIKSADIKIGYAGNLDIQYLDWDLLRTTFESFKNVDFYLAGSMKKNHKLDQYSNVHYLGVLSKNQLNSFLAQMDLLLLAYQADTYAEQLANPHKIMEYLASGKPIVASYTKEYEGLGLLEMTNKNAEFPALLKYSIIQKNRLNSLERISKRQQYAFDHSYERQVNKIEKIIRSK